MSAPHQAMAKARTGYVVSLDGHVISDADTPAPIKVGVRFNSDGTVDRLISGPSYLQIDSATDWRIPNAGSGTFHIRATLNAQTGSGTRVGALGSWLALTSDREWTVEEPTSSQTATWDLDIEISADGGATTLATALYELTAVVL